MGLVLGFVQDLFSAGGLWLNLTTKGSIGFLAGMLSRHVSNATPMIFLAALLGMSSLSGLLFFFWGMAEINITDALGISMSVLLPEAAYNAAIGAAAYWVIVNRRVKGETFGREERIPLRR